MISKSNSVVYCKQQKPDDMQTFLSLREEKKLFLLLLLHQPPSAILRHRMNDLSKRIHAVVQRMSAYDRYKRKKQKNRRTLCNSTTTTTTTQRNSQVRHLCSTAALEQQAQEIRRPTIEQQQQQQATVQQPVQTAAPTVDRNAEHDVLSDEDEDLADLFGIGLVKSGEKIMANIRTEMNACMQLADTVRRRRTSRAEESTAATAAAAATEAQRRIQYEREEREAKEREKLADERREKRLLSNERRHREWRAQVDEQDLQHAARAEEKEVEHKERARSLEKHSARFGHEVRKLKAESYFKFTWFARRALIARRRANQFANAG